MDPRPTQQRQVVLATRERRVRQALRQVPLRRGGPGVPEERGGAPGLERGRGRGDEAEDETVGPRDPAPEQLLGRRLRPADSSRADVPVARRMTETRAVRSRRVEYFTVSKQERFCKKVPRRS